MKLGIIGAMEQEVKTLQAAMEHPTVTTKAGMTFYEGSLRGTPAVVVQSGVGKVNAALCVQCLCDLFSVTHILNTGIAGALNEQLRIGDILISTDAVQHEVDVTTFGYARGQVPGQAPSFVADEGLATLAQRASQGVEAFREDQPVATIPGQQNHVIELTRLYATDEAIRDGIDFHSLEDFSLVICKPDRKIIYSGCQWSSISETGALGAMVVEKITVVAAKRIETAP